MEIMMNAPKIEFQISVYRAVPVMNVGAAIRRPAAQHYVFALVFGEFAAFLCAGDQWSPLRYPRHTAR
ncbi:MAG: hypothetical protein IKT52_14770 [Oscillospiraceae bacterium]|nr:hypothetical protein [Oscillospiraceae bacterium]